MYISVMNNTIGLGTKPKLNINIEPIGEVTMDDYDFEVDIYCSLKRVQTTKKEDAIRVDENNYIVLVDSNLLGHGDVKAKVTAYIPDDDFDDGIRPEVAYVATDLVIVKGV